MSWDPVCASEDTFDIFLAVERTVALLPHGTLYLTPVLGFQVRIRENSHDRDILSQRRELSQSLLCRPRRNRLGPLDHICV